MNNRLPVIVSALCGLMLVALPACHKDAAVLIPVAAAPAPAHKYAIGDKAHCPVTNEEFVVSDKTVQVEHDGRYYAFCCADCQPTFEKNPDKFAKK